MFLKFFNLKTTDMKTLKARIFSIFFFVSALSFAQTTDFNIADANGDGSMDRNEFNDGYDDSFSEWDHNQDGVVDDYEMYETQFNRLDQNGDRNLSIEEWDRGYNNMYGDYLESNDFSHYDADDNDNISSEEFYDSFRNTEFFNSYDINRDGTLDRDEINEGVFSNMDQNQDGTLDKNEYDTYSSYYNNDPLRPNGFNRP